MKDEDKLIKYMQGSFEELKAIHKIMGNLEGKIVTLDERSLGNKEDIAEMSGRVKSLEHSRTWLYGAVSMAGLVAGYIGSHINKIIDKLF